MSDVRAEQRSETDAGWSLARAGLIFVAAHTLLAGLVLAFRAAN